MGHKAPWPVWALAGTCALSLPAWTETPITEANEVSFSAQDQMVFNARQAMKQGRYDIAIQTCHKILRQDPESITALKIMGSAYYLMDEHERARKVWTRALEINPDDAEIAKYLSKLRSPEAPDSSP
jgi:Tfp pilus assembly protein PilF